MSDISVYDGMETTKVMELTSLANQICDHLKTTHDSMLDTARCVQAAYEILVNNKKSEADFKHWIEQKLPFGRTTAYKYLTFYRFSQQFPAIHNLPAPQLARFNISALEELASSKNGEIDAKAVSEAIKRAKAGSIITTATVREIKTQTNGQYVAPSTPAFAEPEIPPNLSETVADAVRDGTLDATPEQLEQIAEEEGDIQDEILDDVIHERQPLTKAINEGPIGPTPEEEMERVNSEIDAFCRGLLKYFRDNIPSDPWLEDFADLAGQAERALKKTVVATIKAAKCVQLCPVCEAVGCDNCQGTGRVPESKK